MAIEMERLTPDQGRVKEAAEEYLARLTRRTDPDGFFDKGGRFYLAERERRECCGWIRRPSLKYPYRELLHGRTAEHVANLFGVDPRAVRQAARQMKRRKKMIYITRGRVRGDCMHAHRTLAEAVACVNQDERECRNAGCFSDRIVMRIEDDGTR